MYKKQIKMKKAEKQIKKLNAVQTYEDLNKMNIGDIICDISHRGGVLGFNSSDVADFIGLNVHLLPKNVGAYCNYLGGGLRGSILYSDYSNEVISDEKDVLDALLGACKRVYNDIENESHLNDEEDEEGNTNWDAIGTKKCREGGVSSAY